MRFTEHELTAALNGAAKTVFAAQDKSVRKGHVDVEQAWAALTRFQRYQLLNAIGDQILPVLIALPDVEVETGTRPTFTDEQIHQAVSDRLEQDGGRVRRAALLASRIALVKVALEHVPPRSDPDALIVPDHL